jgi:hypothetical protein
MERGVQVTRMGEKINQYKVLIGKLEGERTSGIPRSE